MAEKTYTARYVDGLKRDNYYMESALDKYKRERDEALAEVARGRLIIDVRMDETKRLYEVIRAGLTK